MSVPTSFLHKVLGRPAALLACLLGLGFTLALPQTAQAGTAVTLFNSLAGNINFVTTGGTFRTKANDGTGTNPACQVTTTSSGALSGIPAGSTIVAAYLYYAGSSNTVDTAVTLNGTNVTADRTFTDTSVEAFYGGFVDLTGDGIVTGNGTYTLTNLAISTGNPWCGDETVLGGWSLVVIYLNNTTETNRVINIYDGFQVFQNNSITLTPANFHVPTSSINGKFAVVTWEGDPTLSGNETLSFNGTVLTDNCNGTNNQYNSTINTLTCTGTAATDDVYYGVDIDTFSISALLTANETTATTFYQSGGDAVVLAAQVISISNVPVSDLSMNKTHSGNFVAGSNGSYTLTVTNNGPATVTGTTTVTDTLPTGETYVSATGTGWSCANASGTVTCTSTAAVTSGANYNPITLTVAVASTVSASIANSASVSNTTLFDNVSGNNSDTDTATVMTASDLQITKTHTGGNLTAGTPTTYTLTVKNNGPQTVTASGTTTVTDVLPAGETYVSATGTGWTCANASGTVTCTSTTAMTSGTSLPAITLKVMLSGSATSPTANTASVSNSLVSDTNNTNDSATDSATVNTPNYVTATKTVTDLTQSPTVTGDTLQYTITITDTAGQPGSNIEVTDALDPDLSGLSVTTKPAGSTDSSTGTNLDITGISIPANGTVTIVFTATVTGSPGDVINNTATIIGGTTSPTPSSPPVIVTGTTTGNKVLYLLPAGIGAATGSFHRVQGTVSTTAKNDNIATNGGTAVWTLLYKTAKATTITGNLVANMYIARGSTQNRTGTRSISVKLAAGASSLTGTNTNCTPTSTTVPTLCAVNITGTLAIPAGTQLTMTLTNTTTSDNRLTIALFPFQNAARQSSLTFDLNPAINVDSVDFFNTVYPSTSTQSVFEPNQSVFIRTVISDPFGCFDIGTGTLTLTDPASTVQVNNANLLTLNKTACTVPTAPNAYAATQTFEYTYALGTSPANGYWTASVMSKEGAEQTISNTGSDTFQVGVPSLLIVKSVTIAADPLGSAKPRAFSGSTAQYNIVVSNTGIGGANGVFVTDAIPANSGFIVGSQTFTDGSTSSGLAAPTFSYDNGSCAGTFTYSPVGGAGAVDANVKCVKATFTAATNMNGQTGVTAPFFTITFKTQVN